MDKENRDGQAVSGQPGDELASRFHEAYERLAPEFGYVTRRESHVPWEHVPENNRALMRAVVCEVLADAARWCDALREIAEYGYWPDGTADIAREALDPVNRQMQRQQQAG